MTNKSEGSSKEPNRPSDSAQAKRPHATLDLKATEIKPQAPGRSEPAAGTAASTPPAAAAATASASVGSKTTPGDGRAASGTAAKPEEKKPEEKKTGAEKSSSPASPASKPPGSGGRVLVPLLAGIAGGIAALLAPHYVPALAPKAPSALDQKAALIEERITKLEAVAGSTQSSELSAQAERIARLEQLAQKVEQMGAAQSALSAETKALGERITQPAVAEDLTQRLAKLEDRLGLLAAAAETDSEKGRIPQLAAVTGRVADLESRVETQVTSLRKSIPDEVGSRLGTIAEASEAARTASQRIDREMQTVKTDVVRLGQKAEELKASQDRVAQALEVLKTDLGTQSSELDGIKTSVAAQLKAVARPDDVTSAIAPVASKLSALENNLAGVVKSEEERKAGAERIVVSLELANLKRAVDSGRGFARELDAVKAASGGRIELSKLDRYKETGLPTLAALESEFNKIAFDIAAGANQTADTGVLDRLMSGARSIVRVRRTDPSPDDKSAEATVARVENALKNGQLGEALALVKELPDTVAGRASEWRAKAEARHAVDAAITGVENELKVSLGGTAAPATEPAPAGSN